MKTIKLIDTCPTIILTILCLILLAIAYNIEGVRQFQENSIFENSQMLILFGIIYSCIKGYRNKGIPEDIRKLFIVASFFVFCLAGREINFGRVFYPLENGGFTKSEDLPHLLIVRYIILLIAIFFVFYFIKNKLYITVVNLLRKSTIYISDIILMLIFIAAAMAGEKFFHNEKYEELFESMLYFTTLCIAIKYCFNKKNILNL